MAKQSIGTKNPSRIRFVMVEAELGDGDIGQITQAITNALRGPAPTVIKRIAAPVPVVNGGAEHAELEPVEEVAEEIETENVTSAAPKAKTPRKAAPKPSVIELDITSDPPLTSIVDPKTNHGRYLVISAWLHDHRKIEAVTADHIYTCFRHLGWPTDILDFAQPLRELKHKQFFTTPERGKYAINQLGLARAMELRAE
jgi:hypothetical protein